VYYLVAISVLLLGMVFMSSSQSSAQLPKDSKGGNPAKEEPKLTCTHPIYKRDQLLGDVNFYKYVYVDCCYGFRLMENPSRRGSLCTACQRLFCPNPGCGCKAV